MIGKFVRLLRGDSEPREVAVRTAPGPVYLSKEVGLLIARQVEARLEVALADVYRMAREAVDSNFDRLRQAQAMEVSALSGRVGRLEGVMGSHLPDVMIKHGAAPDEAAVRGEIELRLRKSGGKPVTGFQGNDMDLRDAPLPSQLHQEARLATAGDVGIE